MKRDRHRAALERLQSSVLSGRGVTSPQERRHAAENTISQGALCAYIKKIHEAASEVTDEEVRSLLSVYSEEVLFELTCAAALGAAAERLESALGAIEDLEE